MGEVRLLDDAQLRELEKYARIRSYPKNTAVYCPQDTVDGVFLVAKGRVRLRSTTDDGKQAILAFVETGEIFGELALLDAGGREDWAETLVDSTIILLAAERLRRLMNSSMDLTLGITKLIGRRRMRIERRLRSLLFRSNRGSLNPELKEKLCIDLRDCPH